MTLEALLVSFLICDSSFDTITSLVLLLNSEFVTFKHIYKAIMNCQSVYSDVVKKEAEAFKVEFKDFIEKENVDLNDY